MRELNVTNQAVVEPAPRGGATASLSAAPAAPASVLSVQVRPGIRAWHAVAWLGLFLLAVTAALTDAKFGLLWEWSGHAPPMAYSSLVLLLLALMCEFMDATIGMGYGTTLTPVLIVLGYPIGMIVPAALLSQFVANLSVAFFHHKAGNFNFWHDHQTRNAGLLMGSIGLAVSVLTMALALKLPDRYLRSGITLLVLGIGLFMLVGSQLKISFRMRNVAVLAGLAAFNKAFSGGGYGPLVCGGQVLVGLPVRAAVASTAIAESLVCVAAVVTFYASGRTIPMAVLLPLVVGAVLSTPLSAITLRRLPPGAVKRLMSVAILALAVYALWQGKGI